MLLRAGGVAIGPSECGRHLGVGAGFEDAEIASDQHGTSASSAIRSRAELRLRGVGGTLDKQDMPQTRAALIRQTAASHQSGKHHGIAYHANTNARLIAPLVFCSPLGHVNQLQEVHHWIKRTCSKRP